jgi:hypothetical protein
MGVEREVGDRLGLHLPGLKGGGPDQEDGYEDEEGDSEDGEGLLHVQAPGARRLSYVMPGFVAVAKQFGAALRNLGRAPKNFGEALRKFREASKYCGLAPRKLREAPKYFGLDLRKFREALK